MKVIIVSGTPAAGKKTLVKWLSKGLSFKVLDLKPSIKKLSVEYDTLKQCDVVDIKKLNQEVIKIIKEEKKKFKELNKKENIKIKKLNKKSQKIEFKFTNKLNGLIIPSHLIHNLPKRYVDLCIIVKCSNLKKLKKRLLERKYSQKKVMENLQCEIFDVCLEEAKKKKHQILIIDTSEKINQKNLVNGIKKII